MPFPPGRIADERIAMRTCWRCIKQGVDYHDVLGLCPDCIEQLREDSYYRELSEYETPRPEQRTLPD